MDPRKARTPRRHCPKRSPPDAFHACPSSAIKSAAQAVEAAIDHPLDLCPPRYFLLGYGIELALKACLLAMHVQLSKLRSMKQMGHDLDQVLDRTIGLNLLDLVSLSPYEIGAIRLLNETYR